MPPSPGATDSESVRSAACHAISPSCRCGYSESASLSPSSARQRRATSWFEYNMEIIKLWLWLLHKNEKCMFIQFSSIRIAWRETKSTFYIMHWWSGGDLMILFCTSTTKALLPVRHLCLMSSAYSASEMIFALISFSVETENPRRRIKMWKVKWGGLDVAFFTVFIFIFLFYLHFMTTDYNFSNFSLPFCLAFWIASFLFELHQIKCLGNTVLFVFRFCFSSNLANEWW